MKVVIFGAGPLASVLWHALTHDSPHEAVGFTVDRAYLSDSNKHGLPVVPFEEVERHFPPAQAAMMTPLGGRHLNDLRAEKHRAGKAKGYHFISYVSSRALTWPDVSIGENSMIFEGAAVQPFASVGQGVILRAGASVAHHGKIGDYCFLAGHACLGGRVTVGDRCFLGLNCTILDGVTIARRNFIAAGAVVTADTEEGGLYMGVPARRSARGADSVY